MHPAFLYLPGDRLTLPELSAARLDGDVVELGDCYIPADLVEGAEIRAAAVSALISPGSAASGPTAAWIHGAGDAPPSPHHARRAVSRRIRPRPHQRLVFHDTPIPPSDILTLGGIAVTTPLRTMIDLALGLHRDPTLLPWTRALDAIMPGLTEEAVGVLRSTTRVPGSRAGVSTLERLSVRRR